MSILAKLGYDGEDGRLGEQIFEVELVDGGRILELNDAVDRCFYYQMKKPEAQQFVNELQELVDNMADPGT